MSQSNITCQEMVILKSEYLLEAKSIVNTTIVKENIILTDIWFKKENLRATKCNDGQRNFRLNSQRNTIYLKVNFLHNIQILDEATLTRRVGICFPSR